MVTVIPLQKGIWKDSLTYFSTKDIPAGSIVSILVRNKKILGLICQIKKSQAWQKKEELINFIKKIKPFCDSFDLLSIKNTPLKNIYFPKLMPKLTDLQKKALELAIKEGYYEAPKRTSLRKLAVLMKISLATFQKHLQKAESKVIPDTLSFLKQTYMFAIKFNS